MHWRVFSTLINFEVLYLARFDKFSRRSHKTLEQMEENEF